MEKSDLNFVEIDGFGKVCLNLKKVKVKEHRKLQELQKDPEKVIEGLILSLSWAVKEDGSPAFSEDDIDNMDFETIENIFQKLSENTEKGLEEFKKN